MDAGMVAQVRRFNRVVTQRVGALDDHFLARDRPLGEARLLWEIADGREVRELRSALGLDSGYVSRMLRSLEAAGLVTVGPVDTDKRVRIARLTRAGRAERAELDRRSDRLASDLLGPLDDRQRRRLVAAMADVERLLTATLITVTPADPADDRARFCLTSYVEELDRRFDGGFDPALSISADAEELRPPAGVVLLATVRSEPVGCAALKLHGPEAAEIKRMWVSPSARGLGVGRRLLTEIESYAARAGVRLLRLETNDTLTEAISLYRSAGYAEVEPFSDDPYARHWFEKRLSSG